MIIKQNKGQTVGFLVFALIGFAILLFPLVFDLREMSHEANIILDVVPVFWTFRVLCAISCVTIGACFVYYVKQLFSKDPLIEICDDYLYDNSSAISVGKILWEDIESTYMKGSFLNFVLKNPAVYRERIGVLGRLLVKINKKMGFGDICISPQRFKAQATEFLQALNEKLASKNMTNQ